VEGVRFPEHTTDLELEVKADSPEELFRRAGLAVIGIVAEPPKGTDEKRLTVTGPDYEHLMVTFLEELLYLFESEGFAVSDMEVRVEPERLTAFLKGGRAHPKTGVKAVTWHELRVGPANVGWEAHFILDI